VLKAETDTNTVYYTRGFELISRREGTVASYYIYDGGLSVRALTNEAGTVTDTLVSDAFGNETTKTGSSDNPYGFQGEEQDATGLYYLRARYMDPATGTFTSMDTYGGSLTDPMSLHKYLFANSNPVMYSDPSGHAAGSIEDIEATCSIITILASVIDESISIAMSFLSSYLIKTIVVIIVAAIISLIVVNYEMGISTTAEEVDRIIVNNSIPKDVTDAFRTKIAKSLDKAITISEKIGLRKGRSQRELHHIVAKKSLRFNDAHLSRVILSKSGYYDPTKLDNANVDDPNNLVYIKTSLHRRLHSYEYHAYVYANLNAVYKADKSVEENYTAVTGALRLLAAQLLSLSEMSPDVIVI
jgi:RHS repeat-associated protein